MQYDSDEAFARALQQQESGRATRAARRAAADDRISTRPRSTLCLCYLHNVQTSLRVMSRNAVGYCVPALWFDAVDCGRCRPATGYRSRLRNATSAAATPATSAGESGDTSEEEEPEDEDEEEEEVRRCASCPGGHRYETISDFCCQGVTWLCFWWLVDEDCR